MKFTPRRLHGSPQTEVCATKPEEESKAPRAPLQTWEAHGVKFHNILILLYLDCLVGPNSVSVDGLVPNTSTATTHGWSIRDRSLIGVNHCFWQSWLAEAIDANRNRGGSR